MKLEITTPWPAKELSPNSRAHWAVKAKAAKRARRAARMLTTEALINAGRDETLNALAGEHTLHLWLTFCPPDRRRRDDDNLTATFKNWRDGIADALNIDDRRFRAHPVLTDPAPPGGEVRVVITETMEGLS